MELFVDTICQLGRLFAFGTALIEPILTDGGTTLLVYISMDAVTQSSYYNLYKDLVVTIIMTKNYRYDNLRKWLVHSTIWALKAKHTQPRTMI